MDSVTLRQSHFKLGGDINKYVTSSMEQSEGIENHKQANAVLDQKARNELRKSHFMLVMNYVKVILSLGISNLILIQHFVENIITNRVHYRKIK